ncbi:MAG: adenylate kinase [Chitinophagales bacterium]|nr:adenylate kinase [Chitinophagales bacterium]MDW8427139.1 adenylate kinase [Chitinophagales bacterium]
MINLVLFGPPGSGKGTQAVLLRDRYQLLHLSTGDVFRREIQNHSPLGQQVSSYLSEGRLVPDELTFQVLVAEIQRSSSPAIRGLLFDGYPRTVTQAQLLDDYLRTSGQPLRAVLSLQVSDQEVIRRILLRGATSGRTDDTSQQVIQNRLNVYKEQTLPLADYYRQHGLLYTIAGEGTIGEVHQRLCSVIDRFLTNNGG